MLSWIKDDDTFAHVEICQQVHGENIVYNIDEKRTFKDLNELQEHYKNEENRVRSYAMKIHFQNFLFFLIELCYFQYSYFQQFYFFSIGRNQSMSTKAYSSKKCW